MKIKNMVSDEMVKIETINHLQSVIGDETFEYLNWLVKNLDKINLAGYCFENFNTLDLIEDMSGLYFMDETNWINYLKKNDESL
jgi:hypothetical protein